MKTFIVLVVFYIMIIGTNIPIGCSGMTVELEEPGQENQSSRLARSLHASQSALCPEGSSLERCFYSQLSMFIRMHDSLMDPVALRNIGKRNQPTRTSSLNPPLKNNEFIMSMVPGSDLETRLQEIRNIAGMINVLKHLLDRGTVNETPGNSENIQSNLFTPERLQTRQSEELRNIMLPEEMFSDEYGLEKRNVKDSMDNIIANFLGLKGIEASYTDETVKPKETKDMSRNFPVKKRQPICPPDSSQRECFDNAFSYYVRLLKTLQSH